MNWLKDFPREKFTELIATGKTELQALRILNEEREMLGQNPIHEAVIVQLQVKRPAFRESLEEAKRKRADYWFNGIAESVAKEIGKDEVPGEKLKFEQRKYMAAIDNPEKYSEKLKHSLDVSINIFQEMKDLPTREVSKLLKSSDPFIEAEYEDLGEEELEEEDADDQDIFS